MGTRVDPHTLLSVLPKRRLCKPLISGNTLPRLIRIEVYEFL